MRLRQYLVFTVIVGTILGFFSVVSDTLPYQDLTFYDTALRFIAELLNDTITWLGLSIVVGYLFCRSTTQAILMGAGFAAFSITTYFLFGLLDPEQVPSNLEPNMLASVAQWLLISVVGGAVGSLIGFTFKKHPNVLLLFVAFISMRLIQREHTWQNAAGIMENIVFIAVAVGSIALLVGKRRRPDRRSL